MTTSGVHAVIAEQHASWARAIAGLLGEGWEWTPAGVIKSDRVTVNLPARLIEFASNGESGGVCGVTVDSNATLGTYATLARALHGLTDSRAREELASTARVLRTLADRLLAWEREHNKP